MKRQPKQIDLAITQFSKKGYGVGYHNDKPVEVPFTMPGDQVTTTLFPAQRRRHEGSLDQIVVPSSDRVATRCKHFGVCGGCRWQHVPYEMQLQLKEKAVEEAFSGLLQPDTQVLPIVPCDPPWIYRNKMEFSFSSDAKGERYLGLIMQRGRGKVVQLTECHLVNPWFSDAIACVKKWWEASGLEAYHLYRNTGSLRTLILREGLRTGDRMAMVTVSGNPDYAVPQEQIQQLVNQLVQTIEPKAPGAHLSLFLRIQQIAKGQPTSFYEMQLHGPDHIRETLRMTIEADQQPRELSFKIAPSAFFQPNPAQAEKLYSRALQMVSLNPDALVYDLCCGTGTLGITAAPWVKEVIGIELSPEAAIDARTNAKDNGLTNVTIVTGDVAQVLAQILETGEKTHPSLIMVDPPRPGLGPQAVQHILSLQAREIAYISCNPLTQAIDVQGLIAGGYTIKAMQAVDQFPQTPHIENIVILRRTL